MSCTRWSAKDPNEVLDYQVDWQDATTPTLETGETISTSVFTVVSGTVTIDSQSNTTTVATVWLSGGTDGEDCQLLNRVTTSAGRTYDQTVSIRIRSH